MKLSSMLEVNNLYQLRQLTCEDVPSGCMTPEEVRHIFELCEAFWLHSGDPKDPHVELTGGLHSDGFVDTLRALSYTNLCQIFGLQLKRRLHVWRQNTGDTRFIDWVIGSDHAGAAISHTVATLLNARHDFTEKDPSDKSKQGWSRLDIKPGELVLQVEDLVTKTGTLKAVREGVNTGNPHKPVQYFPATMTVISRSTQSQFEDGPILYLAHFNFQTWTPEDCPLCKAGSKKIGQPKKNWAELTGKL